jgi:hypothetical protein
MPKFINRSAMPGFDKKTPRGGDCLEYTHKHPVQEKEAGIRGDCAGLRRRNAGPEPRCGFDGPVPVEREPLTRGSDDSQRQSAEPATYSHSRRESDDQHRNRSARSPRGDAWAPPFKLLQVPEPTPAVSSKACRRQSRRHNAKGPAWSFQAEVTSCSETSPSSSEGLWAAGLLPASFHRAFSRWNAC